jgi:riboflavin synthase alpha subunit
MAPTSTTRWMTKRCSVQDERAVCLQLSRGGHLLARHIDQWVCHMEATLTEFAYLGCMRTAVPTLPQML